MSAFAHFGHARGVDGLYRADGIALNTRNLHQSAHWVAGKAQIMLQSNLRGVFHLGWGCPQQLSHACGGHSGGRPHLALAANLGSGDGRIFLDNHANGTGGQ